MKSLKSILLWAALVLAGASLSGCHDEQVPYGEDGIVPEVNDKPSAKPIVSPSTEDKNVPEDRMKILTDSLRTLSADLKTKEDELKSLPDDIVQINTQIAKLDKSSSNGALVFGGALIIALILTIVALFKNAGVASRVDRLYGEIEGITRELQHIKGQLHGLSNQRNSAGSSQLNRDIEVLQRKVVNLERVLAAPQPARAYSPASVQDAFDSGQGYFGLPCQFSGNEYYFPKLILSRDSDARFRVSIKGDTAEFEPLEGNSRYINEIKSSDTLRCALKTEGCAPSETNSMTVLRAGSARKSGDSWIIKELAVIKLNR